MAGLVLKDIMKIYPLSEDQKKKKTKKGEPKEEKKVNLQITDEGVVAVQQFNIDIKDKYYVGYFKNEKLIAVLDLIDGYPKKDIVFIGFFMMDINIQKNGIGSAIVNELIKYLTTLEYKEVRLGWINGNLQAEHFWIKNGFCPIKEDRVVLANRTIK